MRRALPYVLRVAGLLLLAGQVSACMSRLPGPPGLGISTDGHCVYRRDLALDGETGESIAVRERFCGGPARVVD